MQLPSAHVGCQLGCGPLMPSTPLGVSAGRFTLFRVVIVSVSTGQRPFGRRFGSRVLRHTLRLLRAQFAFGSTRISRFRELAGDDPSRCWCPDESRDRTHRWIPLADDWVRVEGVPGLRLAVA
jgi:hypothetical protein